MERLRLIDPGIPDHRWHSVLVFNYGRSALGFISYAVVKAFSGRGREIGWLTYLLAIVLAMYFVFVRSRMG